MKKIIITDIGSTTTKALLLIENDDKKFCFKAIQNYPTTVEKPFEDVNIGVYNSIVLLEKETNISLLNKNSKSEKFSFIDDVSYLTTSSAGGGLQILVVGLTLFDSASSAKRAAFGAGGVLLDVFAIDDKRSNLEKINLIKLLHPDIILFSGGTDGGAEAPIMRLGEVLMLGSPKPKFSIDSKLPLIYAGNSAVQNYIQDLFSDDYDLHIVPNIRPNLKSENLQPARDKIHELFMESVMEQAPGYAKLKKIVDSDIIPTPIGVLKSLEILSNQNEENILSVDIGGATTDIFSKILNTHYRTVSANYGMSYSISNVMKDAGFENVRRWLPKSIGPNYIRNYISNKMLNPTFTSDEDVLIAIEHAIAREAFRLAKKQHLDMNFNTKRLGYLDRLKETKKNKFVEKLYYADNLAKETFALDDFGSFIGAGGVVSHTKNKLQAFHIIASGLEAKGITSIWRDKYFITPHLGKLAEIDPETASKILNDNALEKLGIVIKPFGLKWKNGKNVIDIQINDKNYTLKVGEYKFIQNEKNDELNVQFKMHKGFSINNIETGSFNTNYPIIIDTLPPETVDFDLFNDSLNLYNFEHLPNIENVFHTEEYPIIEGDFEQNIALPYSGDITVKVGENVTPDNIVGINKFDPPIIYIITFFDKTYLGVDKDNFKEHLLVNVGEEINIGDKLAKISDKSTWQKIISTIDGFYSAVRGIIESIDYNVGTMIVREIQDYDTKPHVINIAERMNIPPNRIGNYLKKVKGEFVHRNDILAKRVIDKFPVIIPSPTCGTVKNIDTKTGTITIQFDKKPHKNYAQLNGKVISTDNIQNIKIGFHGTKLNGKIGFGKSVSGKLSVFTNFADIQNMKDKIIFIDEKLDLEQLNILASQKIGGLIIPGIDNIDLVDFIGEEIGIALTGNENISFPIILLEGFGDFKTPQKFINLFSQKNGADVHLKPHTQIRAGVSRPEIIFSDGELIKSQKKAKTVILSGDER